MDVTILVAPAGNGIKPVKFRPTTHVVSAPNDGNAEDFLDRYTEKLKSQYYSEVYIWESIKPTPDLMGKFERYVAACEEKRLVTMRDDAIKAAYNIAAKIYDDFYRIGTAYLEFAGALRQVIPGFPVGDSRRVILEVYEDGTIVDFPEFVKAINAECERFSAGGKACAV